MASLQKFQVIIIGGGPIGLACAIEAQKAGLTYLVIEKGALVNSLFHYPANMTFFSTAERLEIGGVPFVTTSPKPKKAEALEYYRRVAQDKKITVQLFERVNRICQDPGSGFLLETSKASYKAENVIVATGFYDLPYLLHVPGEELPKVLHYYDDPHKYALQRVVVVGAQNSAVDAALETWRKGAEVTMVIRGAEIGERVKYWVKPDIENRIAEGSIKAWFNSTIVQVTPRSVIIETPQGIVEIENDWVLSLTGYQPDLAFLLSCGVELSRDGTMKPVYNEVSHETNVPGIYLAGVICGGMNTHRLFIENSREHAEKIIRHIQQQV